MIRELDQYFYFLEFIKYKVCIQLEFQVPTTYLMSCNVLSVDPGCCVRTIIRFLYTFVGLGPFNVGNYNVRHTLLLQFRCHSLDESHTWFDPIIILCLQGRHECNVHLQGIVSVDFNSVCLLFCKLVIVNQQITPYHL